MLRVVVLSSYLGVVWPDHVRDRVNDRFEGRSDSRGGKLSDDFLEVAFHGRAGDPVGMLLLRVLGVLAACLR